MRVLVVEDEQAVAQLLTLMLETDADFEVKIARDSAAAERILKDDSEEFDGIVLDLNLGNSMGLHTYEKIRGAAPETAIITYTGDLDEQTSRRLASDGVRVLIKGLADSATIVPIIRGSIASFKATRTVKQLLNSA